MACGSKIPNYCLQLVICNHLLPGMNSCCQRQIQRLCRVSSLQPMGHMWSRMAMNAAQHKIVNLLKTFFCCCSCVFISVCVFNVWPQTILLPVWPRDAKRLYAPVGKECLDQRYMRVSTSTSIWQPNPYQPNPQPHAIPTMKSLGGPREQDSDSQNGGTQGTWKD